MGHERKEYQTVVLAALLHDVGKFLGRSQPQLLEKDQHPKFSADFVSAFSEVFSQVSDVSLLHDLVQHQHKDKRSSTADFLVQTIEDKHARTLATLVSIADTLSSSEQGEAAEQGQDYWKTPLTSALERLNRVGDYPPHLRYHAKPLDRPDCLGMVFPREFASYEQDELNGHIKEFGHDYSQLFLKSKRGPVDTTDFDCLISHLSNVLCKYTWCIPSSMQELIPDVSLFDHLRSTAAIASSLYLYHSKSGPLKESEVIRTDIKRFCLVVGDLSGIQNYIFDVASVGAGGGVARRLRARSLFVQLCSEIASHLILHKLNVPIAVHNIMSSGGRFYLLLPNLPETTRSVQEVQHVADTWFKQELNGELALNLAYAEFGDEGFKAGESRESGFSQVLEKAAANLNLRKKHRFAEALSSSTHWSEEAFPIDASYEGKGTCHSCRKFPVAKNELCSHCLLDQVVGAILPNARYLAFFDSQAGKIPLLGYSVTPLESLGATPRASSPHKPYLVMKLNDPDLSELGSYSAGPKYLATFTVRPDNCEICTSEKSSIATFECIAKRSDGVPLLGFLKADVDRLGESFIFGLRSESVSVDTISRISTLSRMLDLFFAGWVENLTSSGDFYTVFSGGDDMFLIGPWDKILRLAEKLKDDLATFTGNPILTLSAGVVIARHDYPIASAAEAANGALRKSKLEGRNRITILGTTLTWSDWDKIGSEWEYLGPLTNDTSKVSSAFLHNLLRFYQMWAQYRIWQKDSKQGSVLGLRYHPLLAYTTTRNLDPRKTPELYEWTKRLLKWPPDEPTKQLLDNLGLLATLLIYGRRGGKE